MARSSPWSRVNSVDERLTDAPAVVVVEVQHGAPIESEPIADPARERGAVGEIARAEAKGVGADTAHVGRRRRGRDRDDRVLAAVVHRCRREGLSGEEVADDRRDARVVEIGGDEDGRVGVREVVALEQLDGTPTDAARRIDLLDGELGRQLHGGADGIGERAGEADEHGPAGGTAGGRGDERKSDREERARSGARVAGGAGAQREGVGARVGEGYSGDLGEGNGDQRLDRRAPGGDVRPARTAGARSRWRTPSGFSARRRARGPGAVVRLITGRGRSGGGAPIRTRTRTLLRRLRDEGAIVREFVLEDGEGQLPRAATIVRRPGARARGPTRRARRRPPAPPTRPCSCGRSAR